MGHILGAGQPPPISHSCSPTVTEAKMGKPSPVQSLLPIPWPNQVSLCITQGLRCLNIFPARDSSAAPLSFTAGKLC